MKNRTVVLDVNVWISIFLSRKFETIEVIVFDNSFTIFSSAELLSELRRVLGYKKFKWEKPIDSYVQLVKNFTTYFPTLPVFKDCRDTKDNYLFDLAIQSGIQPFIKFVCLLKGHWVWHRKLF